MTKAVGMILLLIGAGALAVAAPVIAPEIDPGTAGSALALLSGAVLIFRSARKK
jgi:hypothetical protein